MTVTDKIKILDRKIKQNERQYDSDRKAAKISALFSNDLDKCEYLTGEDLGLKPSTVEQAKFEYSPLGKVFSKGLDEEEDKKEGLLKRLKNTEDKNEQQLKIIKNRTENIKEVTDFVEESLIPEAKALIEEIRTIQKDVDYRKLKTRSGNNVTYDFSDFKTFKELFRDLYYKKRTIDDAEMKQDEFNSILGILSNYAPKSQKYIEAKNKLLDNAKNLYKAREKIIEGFKNGIFPLNHDDEFKEARHEAEEAKNIRNKNGLIDHNKLMNLIYLKEKDTSDELVRKHFIVQDLGHLLERMKELKNNNNKKKNKK